MAQADKGNILKNRESRGKLSSFPLCPWGKIEN
jgi:hypothetical protein